MLASTWWIPYTANADLRADFDELISKLSLNNLIDLKNQWATFGALSDNELTFIKSAATGLRLNMSKDKWEQTLNSIINKLQLWKTNNYSSWNAEVSSYQSNISSWLNQNNLASEAQFFSY
jgi:hypothetical protein